MGETGKTAVVLFNLGGPDSRESIEPFLFNFFMDPNIVAVPKILRYFLARRISKKRSAAEAGQSYGELGGFSPLLKNTQAQADALENSLGAGFKVFVCMRYWHPMAREVVQAVKEFDPDKIVLLPLYPQFSTTTTWSSLGQWRRFSKVENLAAPVSLLCCYPFNEGFVKAATENIHTQYKAALKNGHKNIRILFSAHGLPEKIVKSGDPYQWQCEQTAEKVAERLEIENLDWRVCYQSRVGPLKWIGPSLDEALGEAVRDKKSVIIFPHAFTQEHVETLVELDIEYRNIAGELGIPGYYRAGTVSTHPDFIKGLADLVREHKSREGVWAEGFKPLCPEKFTRCCMKAA